MSDPDPIWTGLPRDSAEAASHIEHFTADIVLETLTVKALAATLKGAKKLIEQAAREYAERFLFELIQNAYDAHPHEARGRVRVILDAAEGPFGCLYVANTGTPFTAEDFQAICEIAQSSKQPGEGIGNKGVGFKSVLQIAEWPEIYSRSAQRDGFDGYCFRFATPSDVKRLVDTEAQAKTLGDRISPYWLPIHIGPAGQNTRLRALAGEGFASVVRLPLRNEEAAEIAHRQIDEAQSDAAPLLLFLDRIAELQIEIAERDAQVEHHNLIREERACGIEIDDIESCEVVLREEQRPADARRYLMITRTLDPDAFQSAIDTSIKATLVDEAWGAWKGGARISAAVHLGRQGSEHTRLYCYLPMADKVDGPFAGHLNAPFAVKLARDGLVRGAALNDFLLNAAADLVAHAASAVRGHPEGRGAVVDLVAWKSTETSAWPSKPPITARLIDAFRRAGSDLTGEALVPTLGPAGWTSLASATTCDPRRVLTPEAVARAGIATIVDPSLGSDRVSRLDSLASVECGRSVQPRMAEIADWAEAIARQWAGQHREDPVTFNPEAWASLYDDLAEIYAGTDPSPLRGRMLLIDDAFALHATGGGADKGQPAVFFPMRETREDGEAGRDPTIPKTLAQHLAYVHGAIQWKTPDPGTGLQRNRPGRDFLDGAGLVAMPRTRELLIRIAAVLKSSRDKQKHSDALRLIYNLTRGRQYTQSPTLAELNIRVPTAGGLQPAGAAVFSGAWPGTRGGQVEDLIREAGGASGEIAELSGRLLAPPGDFGFRIDDVSAWVSFLALVGVADGLPPIDNTPRISEAPGSAMPDRLISAVVLPDQDRERWKTAVQRWAAKPKYARLGYRLTGRVMRLPGSFEYDLLPAAARRTYGRLVVAGLATWDDSVLAVRVGRPPWAGYKDFVDYPSPVSEFLRQAEWLPVTRPGAPGEEDFVRPTEAWHYRDNDNEAQPTFMPLIVTAIRRELEQARDADRPSVTARMKSLGMSVWNDRVDAGKRLAVLADTYARLGVADTLVVNFRKAYERTWSLLLKGLGSEPAGGLRSLDQIVVTRRGRLEVQPVDAPAPPFVLVDQDRLVSAILDTLDLPVLRADPKDGQEIADRLEQDCGVRVAAVGATDVRVLVDDLPVEERDGEPLVRPDRRWLSDLLTLTLEFKASEFNRQTDPRIRAAADQLRLIRLHSAGKVEIRLRGEPVQLPGHLRRVFAVAAAGRPSIAFEGSADPVTWDLLSLLSTKIGELAVGAVETASAFESVVTSLAMRLGGSTLIPPTDEDYAVVFEESPARILEVRTAHRSDAVVVADLLRPVVIALCGEDLLGARLFGAGGDPDSAAVLAALKAIAGSLPVGVSPERLMHEATRALTLADIRDAFRAEIGYGDFNRALRLLGRAPLWNAQGHLVAMATYVADHRDMFLQTLRSRALREFDGGAIPAAYAAMTKQLADAQRIRATPVSEWTGPLDPDPQWLDDFSLPPEHLLATRVEAWIGAIETSDDDPAADLPPIDAVRTANARVLDAFAERVNFRLRLWSPLHLDVTVPTFAAEDLRAELRGRGLLDFRALTDEGIIGWLSLLERWPTGLPDSIELGSLGLTEADLDAERAAAEQARAERLQERRSVKLDGAQVSLDPEHLPDLLEALRAGLLYHPLPEGPDSPVVLGPAPKRRVVSDTDSDPDPNKHLPDPDKDRRPPNRMTSQQTDLVGFMGEWVVYAWLKSRYGSRCRWRSTYRRYEYPADGDAGNDNLGYDIEVLRSGGDPLMFEVKASTTDELAFEMSAHEIGCAERNAENDRYRIVYVANVNDSSARRLTVLPNPASADGRGRYRIVPRGIRYEFGAAPRSVSSRAG